MAQPDQNLKIQLRGQLIKIGNDGWGSSQTFAEIKNINLNKHDSAQKDVARIALTNEQAQEMAKYLFQDILVTIEPVALVARE